MGANISGDDDADDAVGGVEEGVVLTGDEAGVVDVDDADDKMLPLLFDRGCFEWLKGE
jgi:hypothetical protein